MSGRTIERVLYGVVAVVAILLCTVPLASCPPRYTPGSRTYRIQIGQQEAQRLRADRIERRDGCVAFWRAERIDTLVCESVGALVVTEVYE